MKPQIRPFVVVTKRRQAERTDAQTAFLTKSAFKDSGIKPVTKEDVRAGLARR